MSSAAPLPNLSLPGLIRLTWREWRTNPLCPRVWRRIRPFVTAIIGVELVARATAVGIRLVVAAGPVGGPPARVSPILPALFIAAAFLLFLVFGVFAIVWGPSVYGRWAYQATYLQDPMLRLSNLTRQDRVMGVFAPVILAIVLFFGLAIPFQFFHALMPLPGSRFPPPKALLSWAVAIGAVLTYAATATVACASLFATSALRKMIRDSELAPRALRRPDYVAAPLLIFLLCVLCHLMLRSERLMTMLRYSPHWWGWQMVMDLLFLFVVLAVMRAAWRRDIPIARECLFGVEDGPGGQPNV